MSSSPLLPIINPDKCGDEAEQKIERKVSCFSVNMLFIIMLAKYHHSFERYILFRCSIFFSTINQSAVATECGISAQIDS